MICCNTTDPEMHSRTYWPETSVLHFKAGVFNPHICRSCIHKRWSRLESMNERAVVHYKNNKIILYLCILLISEFHRFTVFLGSTFEKLKQKRSCLSNKE